MYCLCAHTPSFKIEASASQAPEARAKKNLALHGSNVENVPKNVYNHSEIWMSSKTKIAPKARTHECLVFCARPLQRLIEGLASAGGASEEKLRFLGILELI